MPKSMTYYKNTELSKKQTKNDKIAFALQAAAEDDVDVAEPLFMIDNSKFEMVNSRYAMTTICNVLMNITVLEPQYVNETPIFFHILKFIMNSLPNLDNNGKQLDLEI